MSCFYKVIRGIMRVVVPFMYRVKCVGRENIPADGAFMLCSNHTSMLDIPLLISLCPRQLCFMAKKELFENSILGWIFRKMGAFPVDRGGRDIASIRHALGIVKNGDVLAIFPEGKRYKSGAMREVKAGASFIAVKTGADLVPVSIYKEGKAHPFRRVTVRFGEVLKNADFCPEKATKENLSEVSQKIYNSINDMWELKF